MQRSSALIPVCCSLSSNFPFTGVTQNGEGIEKSSELKGFSVSRTRVKVGTGQTAYRRAVDAVFSFENIEFDWFFTNRPPVKTGAPVVETTQTLFLWSLLPLKITWIDKDAAPKNAAQKATVKRRAAFGHTTMEGHQLSGEEGFAVEWLQNDDVYYEALIVSRPASLLSMASLPVLKLLQYRFVADSVAAVKKAAAGK